jgi:Protein of unknown function (DUF3995)
MIVWLAIVLFVVLQTIADLHAAWGFGWRWPSDSEIGLARAVVGRAGIVRMPSLASCLVVAALLAAMSLWPLFATGLLPAPWPSWLTQLGGLGLTVVFVGRGIAGYVPAWRTRFSEQPFASLDQRLYSPLCLAVGVGILTILIASTLP